jgi:hypothetical protein
MTGEFQAILRGVIEGVVSKYQVDAGTKLHRRTAFDSSRGKTLSRNQHFCSPLGSALGTEAQSLRSLNPVTLQSNLIASGTFEGLAEGLDPVDVGSGLVRAPLGKLDGR